MNKELLRKMLDEEYVMVQKHPDAELYIYNYTSITIHVRLNSRMYGTKSRC